MADYITAIRTAEGDKKIDYNALANKPTSMTPEKHADTHKLGGDDPLWLASKTKSGFMSTEDKIKLDAVDFNKINAINNLNQYVWKRRPITDKEVKAEAAGLSIKVASTSPTINPEIPTTTTWVQNYVYYADSYSVYHKKNGTMQLKNFSCTDQLKDPSQLDVVKGKYWIIADYKSSTISPTVSTVYYTPEDAQSAVQRYITGPTEYHRITYLDITAHKITRIYTEGEWQDIYDASATKYPHAGISGGYEYIYYGGLDRIVRASTIGTPITYAGTADNTTYYTSSYHPTITFDDIPRMVLVVNEENSYYGFIIWGLPRIYIMSSGDFRSHNCKFNNTNKTVSFGPTSKSGNEYGALNAAGYYYDCYPIY